MKRKLHPRRRHGPRHVSAKSRHEALLGGYFGGFKAVPTREGRFPAFPRARVGKRGRATMNDLHAAGYGFASLAHAQDWSIAHDWLRETCVTAYGREYTWFGGTFWFARPEHREAFMGRFACADGHEPVFAFET